MKVNHLPEAHIYKPEIRFVDIDAAGIVNNATYLNYFEQSRIQFFEELVGKKWDWNSAGMVIAKHEVNYRQPIFFQDDVTIVTWIERVGTKSMEAAYEIFKMVGEEPPPATAPPLLGAHTDTVLREVLGLDDAKLRELREAQVIS